MAIQLRRAAGVLFCAAALLAAWASSGQSQPRPARDIPHPPALATPDQRFMPGPVAKPALPPPLPTMRPDPKAMTPGGTGKAEETPAAVERAEHETPPPPPFEPEVAISQCRAELAGAQALFEPVEPMLEKGECGTTHPVSLSALGDLAARLVPAATANCAMTGALAHWMNAVVQQAALDYLGEPVLEVQNVSSYTCRRIGNRPSGKLSEHARANAQDIAAFRTASGGWIDVKSNWSQDSKEGRFLWAVHQGACAHFSTVLGPDADADHVDHFHLDLGRGGRQARYRICQ